MSEKLVPDNPDELPKARLHIGEQKLDATPENASLFRFAGRLSMYDHALVIIDDDDEVPTGAFVFRSSDAYEPLEEFMVEHDFPIHDNLREVSQSDLDTYEAMVDRATETFEDDFAKLLDEEQF